MVRNVQTAMINPVKYIVLIGLTGRVEAIEVSVAGYDLDRSLNQGSDTGSNERKDRSTEGVSRTSRRSINLNELDEEDFEELTEEEQLEAEIMTANGTSVDFKA